MNIKESYTKKGGRNLKPSTNRPLNPPEGQSVKKSKGKCERCWNTNANDLRVVQIKVSGSIDDWGSPKRICTDCREQLGGLIRYDVKKKDKIKRIDIKEFRAMGFLADLNRCYLHPLGMALESIVADDGSEKIGGIWDCRDDPEGILFTEYPKELIEKVEKFKIKRHRDRKKGVGYIIQTKNYIKPLAPSNIDDMEEITGSNK